VTYDKIGSSTIISSWFSYTAPDSINFWSAFSLLKNTFSFIAKSKQVDDFF